MSTSSSVTPVVVFFAIAALLVFVPSAQATTDYAAETGQECSVCHISASGGGGLTQDGESYSADPGNWKVSAASTRRTPIYQRFAHVAILYAHVFFGIIWIGTILYVHLVLKPKYALGGLPKSELKLAWISMPVLGLSGVLLTVWRLHLTPGLFATLFGKLLLIKITLFLLMVSSASFVTLYVGPRLKALAVSHHSSRDISGKTRFTPDELDGYDGTEGSRTLVAAMGKVYDLSSSPLWKGGLHAMLHKGGRDLTEYLDNAPHGSDVLDRYEKVGELIQGSAKAPPVVRIFTVNAYFNLIGCFIIILVLVLWRW